MVIKKIEIKEVVDKSHNEIIIEGKRVTIEEYLVWLGNKILDIEGVLK